MTMTKVGVCMGLYAFTNGKLRVEEATKLGFSLSTYYAAKRLSQPLKEDSIATLAGQFEKQSDLKLLRAAKAIRDGAGLPAYMRPLVAKQARTIVGPSPASERSAKRVEAAPTPAAELHPLVTLIRKLRDEHGITYLHWEDGQELVFREKPRETSLTIEED